MTYQNEFARRLAQQGGDGENRHPELVSGPRTAEPADSGANTPRHAELDSASRAASDDVEDKAHEILNQVQDDDAPSPDTPSPDSPTTRHDGWLPDLRVKFLEALARCGNVGAAARLVQRSRQSAYDLKRRDPDFARAWLAALVLAREAAQDALQERAIEGVEEEIFYHGEVVATRRRYDSRLLLAHLARLDKIAEQIPAQRGAARFADMLDAIGRGEDTAPLIATPTEDELAEAAAEAEKYPHRQPPEEERDEIYMVTWPEDDEDDRPELLRMCPEEIEQMQREVPGIVITPTGTRDEDVADRLITMAWYGDLGDYSEDEDEDDHDDAPGDDEGEAEGEGKNL